MDEYLEEITQTHFGRVRPLPISFEYIYNRRLYIEDFLETCENDSGFRNYYFHGIPNPNMIAHIFMCYKNLFRYATKLMSCCDNITARISSDGCEKCVLLWFNKKNIMQCGIGTNISHGVNAEKHLEDCGFTRYDEYSWKYLIMPKL